MEITLTKLDTKTIEYGFSLKDFKNRLDENKGINRVRKGKALIEVDWKVTTQNRAYITMPKKTKIFLG